MFKLSTASWHQTTAVVNRTESSSHTVVNRVRRSEPVVQSLFVVLTTLKSNERPAGICAINACDNDIFRQRRTDSYIRSALFSVTTVKYYSTYSVLYRLVGRLIRFRNKG